MLKFLLDIADKAGYVRRLQYEIVDMFIDRNRFQRRRECRKAGENDCDCFRLKPPHFVDDSKPVRSLMDIQVRDQYIKGIRVNCGQRFGHGGGNRDVEFMCLKNGWEGGRNAGIIINEENPRPVSRSCSVPLLMG